MTAPWCVELDEDVLLVVHNHFLVVLGHDDSHGAILLLWDRLALDAGFELAADKLVTELANDLLSELLLLVQGVFLSLDGILDGKGGPRANLEVEVLAVLAVGLCVEGGEVDLALVLLGDGLEVLGELLALFGGFGEDVGKGKVGL